MSKEWRETMESFGPGECLEIADPKQYEAAKDEMSKEGFTQQVFDSLFPIMEQQIWSLFRLWQLGKKVPKDGLIVEIGSGRGGSISTLGLSNPEARLINIDKFSSYDEETAYGVSKDYQGFKYEDFRKNVYPFNLNLQTIQKWSDEAIDDIEDESVDLLFIDGNHSYLNCKNDIVNYMPKVKKGGVLAIHDYHPRFPGVIGAVQEIFGNDFDLLDNSSIVMVEV